MSVHSSLDTQDQLDNLSCSYDDMMLAQRALKLFRERFDITFSHVNDSIVVYNRLLADSSEEVLNLWFTKLRRDLIS